MRKTYGDVVAVDRVDLEVAAGEFFTLLGPSGSGKTTTLRLIAGFELPTAGSVLLDGADVSRLPPYQRDVNTVFQDYALFPHMSVGDNVGYGLMVKRVPKKERVTRIGEALEMVRLPGYEKRKPGQLSGGQRQRIALARALAVEPKVLLLDEPFGALDARVRRELRRWLRRLHEEMHVTSVFVTHDQEEAMEVADRIVLMNHGRIEQDGPPDEVYDHPASPFVLQFLGDVNLFRGGAQALGGEGGADPRTAYVRPHELQVVATAEPGSVPVVFVQALTVGPNTRLEFRRHDDDSYVDVEVTRAEWLALRDRLAMKPGARAFLLPRRVTRFTSEDVDPAAMI